MGYTIIHNILTDKKRFDKFRSSQLNETIKIKIQQRPNNGSIERSLRKREKDHVRHKEYYRYVTVLT